MKNRRHSSTVWGWKAGLAGKYGQYGQMSDEASGSNGSSRARFPFHSRLSNSSHHSSSSREQNNVGRARSGFNGLQQIRQYDVSCQLDIGHNPSSAVNTLMNRGENARFWLRKGIWET